MRCPGLKPGSSEEALATEDIRAYEVNSIWRGVSLDLLMENAGAAVASALECLLGGLEGARVAVLSGKGGNGGDGLAAARRMASRGASVTVYLVQGLVDHPSSKVMLDALKNSSVKVERSPPEELEGVDAVVDAVLGIGVKGALRGPVRKAMEAYNSSPGMRISVDIPTGVNPDTGEAVDGAARSDYTVSLIAAKRGLFVEPGRLHAGEVLVAEIGLPESAVTHAGPGDAAVRVPMRRRDAWKGSAGRVVVVGGSKQFAGAPVLAALAAYAAGVDLVYLVSYRSYDAALSHVELVPRTPDDLEDVVARSHSVVVGPGMGVSDEAAGLVEAVLREAEKRGRLVVADADAIKMISEGLVKPRGVMVITPHRGEARQLLGGESLEPLEAARRIAAELGVTVAVKAPVDAVCNPQGKCRLNDTGVPEMSVGGTGDVLAGVIAGFAARRAAAGLDYDPLNTVAAALYITGRAGEMAVAEGLESITPLKVLENVPRAMEEARRIAGQRRV
ncbi:MAG: NAD(P)H-hydrate dehydratase [Desulfurococcales archaeon]|nr:NAD(P)H-hydrate dehydratase [Desulfurococcales archaeon]